MSNFQQFNDSEMAQAAQRLQSVANNLTKSFSAGTPGAANAERSGLAALAIEDLSQEMKSIALQEDDFILTRDLKVVPAKQTLYEYVVKTGSGLGVDVWGMENFLPQESSANYRRVYEPIKVMGIRKSISHLAQTVNDANGYMLDLEQENEKNALIALGEATERAGYNGGDSFIDASGNIDALIAANPNGPTRQFRGIQAQIREGNYDARGISQDFRGYANNRATIDNAKGAALSRPMIDKICTAVNGNRGKVVEGHATPEQLRLFRQQFFSMDRGDVSSAYAIRGAAVPTEQKAGFFLDTTSGQIEIKSTFFKNEMIYAVPQQGSAGAAPAAPGSITASQVAGTTDYKAGDVIKYAVQSVNFSGRSSITIVADVTIAANGNRVNLSVPYVANCEYFKVFRLEAGEAEAITADGVTSHRFIGNVVASRINGQATVFVDAQAILPGLNTIVFLPKPENRAKLACIGPRVAKIDFGVRGLAQEKGYVSYCAIILELPRQHGMIQNVQEELF